MSQLRLAVCNCSAMVDTLLDNQLFGPVRGTFTSATEMRPGLFEYLDGGTVFLDEVGETSLAMQAKLLRVIQNREVQQVGFAGSAARECSTDRRRQPGPARGGACGTVPGRAVLPLELHSNSRAFADQAARRYSVAGAILGKEIQPRLGQERFRTNAAGATVLLQHPRPGNVRELENVISNASRLPPPGDFIDLADLPENLQHRRQLQRKARSGGRFHCTKLGKVHIQRVLAMCMGNRLRAAQVLGIGRSSLYRHLKRDQTELVCR